MGRRMAADKAIGAEYITFQVALPPRYLHTPFEWRADDVYLRTTVERLIMLRDLCWKHGLNAYFETHIDRVTEDPVFYARVLEHAASLGGLETNGDFSHFIYRGFVQGAALDRVLSSTNHAHVRM